MLFTPKWIRSLAAVFVTVSGLLCGCEKPLDSPEFGELIHAVPPDLNKPFPLPELDPPGPSPLPGPEVAGPEKAENPK